MNLRTFLAILFISVLLNPADAQVGDGASATTQPLAPVNQISRFQLADALPYLPGSLTGLTPNTPILRAGEFRQQDRTIFTEVPQAQGKQAVWVQMSNYWIEPITPPPGRGEPLIVPINSMRVAEAQGEVTLLEFTNPPAKAKTKPIEVNPGMEVPDQATLNSADTGSVAILIGGHTSIRLVPNSRVQFHYDVSGETPLLEVKILRGAVFCKIGRLPSGRVPDVAVHGQVGSLATMGSCDLFAQSDPISLHVCLVRGKLLLGDAIPFAVGNMEWYPADVEANGVTGPQIRHWSHSSPGVDQKQADARLLRFALHQADELNVKIKTLLGVTAPPLSSDDQTYLANIPKITWYEQATASP